MAFAIAEDNVKLYFESAGSGAPTIFVHEFAGDLNSWEPQLRHFGRQYRVIAFNARGYPPSDVPDNEASYSQDRACDDIQVVLNQLGIKKAHIVGLSMGGFATLHFGLRHPERALSLCVAGAGYGSEPEKRDLFREEGAAIAKLLTTEGMAAFAEKYAYGPTRVQFENKDPRGFLKFKEALAKHSALGSANTQLGVQRERPSIYSLTERLRALTLPTLILTGDEDWPCLQPALFLKENIKTAALVVFPNCGHAINLEAPDHFNRVLADFLSLVESGRWPERDPRAVSKSITGMKA